MTIVVSSGVASSGLTVSSGDPLVVLSGGVVQFTTVLSSASATLSAGAFAYDLTVSQGGMVLGTGELAGNITVAGSVRGVTIGASLLYTSNFVGILSGGSASGLILASVGDGDSGFSNLLDIYSGGAATGTVVSFGSEVAVDGSAAGTIVGPGGAEVIYSGGTAPGSTIQAGGLVILFDGSGSGVTVDDGGALDLSGNLASNFTDSGHVVSTTVVNGATVSSGAMLGLQDITVLSGATVSVASGLAVSGATVSSGGVLVGSGADLAGNVLIQVAGTLSGVTIVDSIGVYDGDLYRNPTELVILSGGSAGGVTVADDSNSEVIDRGGVASGTADEWLVDVYGSAAGTVVYAGAKEVIYSGGVATGDIVQSGGVETTSSGGLARGAVALSGGYQLVSSGGVTSGTEVLNGGRQYVSSGGRTSATTVSGGAQTVFSTGVALGTVLSSGGEEVASSGGVASAITILGGGRAAIYAGGSAVDAVISSGGIDYMLGGTTTGTVVGGGGKELVSSGAVAVATTVLNGALDYIYSGGVAEDPVVSRGGSESIASGGTAIGLDLLAGGVAVIDGEVRIGGDGTLAGTLSGSGAIVETEAGNLVLGDTGAAFSGRAVIEGGTTELATSGALGTGYVEFAEPSTGSAVLQIDAADAPAAGGIFANRIVDFSGANEDIDLRSVAFVSGASATVTGSTLVLSDGGATYKFNLAGSVAGAYIVTSDGHGGTLIDPPAIDPHVARFAQNAAAFAPSDPALAALVFSAGPNCLTPFAYSIGSGRAAHI